MRPCGHPFLTLRLPALNTRTDARRPPNHSIHPTRPQYPTLSELEVPSVWLDEAIAYASGYSFKRDLYCESIRKATLFADAEHAFSRLFAPTGIYDGNEDVVKEYYDKCLELLPPSYSEAGDGVGGGGVGGGGEARLYLDYLSITLDSKAAATGGGDAMDMDQQFDPAALSRSITSLRKRLAMSRAPSKLDTYMSQSAGLREKEVSVGGGGR